MIQHPDQSGLNEARLHPNAAPSWRVDMERERDHNWVSLRSGVGMALTPMGIAENLETCTHKRIATHRSWHNMSTSWPILKNVHGQSDGGIARKRLRQIDERVGTPKHISPSGDDFRSARSCWFMTSF